MTAAGYTRREVLLLTLAFEGALAVAALAVGWLIGCPPLASVSWSVLAVGQGGAAAAFLFVLLVASDYWSFAPMRALDALVRDLVNTLFRRCTLADLLWISLAAGVCEELLFRGVLQVAIERYTGSTLAAVAGASVAFGMAHAISRAYAVVATLIGVYLGLLFVVTDNLLAPIVAHAAYDFVALVWLLHDAPTTPPGESRAESSSAAPPSDDPAI